MSKLTLTLRAGVAGRLDLSKLIPEQLLGKTQAEIGKMKIPAGSGQTPVSELFTLEGSPRSATEVVLRGLKGQADNIGANMSDGQLTVHGACGDFIGLNMKGGYLSARGSVGRWAGRGMRAGFLEIHGDAGGYLASAFPGDNQGMRDGLIHVRGNAGHRIGERMRRGVVVIDGDCGDYCGAKMIAGTIIVQGETGKFTGSAMKRGTILLLEEPATLPATFNDCGEYKPTFLALLYRHLANASRHLKDLSHWPVTVKRIAGDTAVGGTGEILILQA